MNTSKQTVHYRHACKWCGRAFQRASALERHTRSIHTKEKPFSCQFCSEAFGRTDLLQRHISLYHKARMMCADEVSAASDAASASLHVLTADNGSDELSAMLNVIIDSNDQRMPPLAAAFADAPFPVDTAFGCIAAGAPEPQLNFGSSYCSSASTHMRNSPSIHSGISTNSTASPHSDLTTPVLQAIPAWPTPSTRHIDLYRLNFAKHISFVHIPTMMQQASALQVDEDLLRAMAIVGGNYDTGATVKACDFYGCGALKQKVLSSVADTEAVGELDQPAGISVAPTARLHFLTRRAQTLVLIQLTACFSESRAHMLAAKLSHGAMIVVSKELLQEAKGLLSISGIMPWSQWVAREEAIRTLWATYIVDSLQAICFAVNTGFLRSDLASLPDIGSDALWEARDHVTFDELQSQMPELIDPSPPPLFSHSASLLKVQAGMGTMPRHLFLLLSITRDVFHLLETDTQSRREMVQSQMPANLHHCNVALAQQLNLRKQLLSEWLATLKLLDPSTSVGDRPFVREVMAWFWACQHVLGLLQGRLAISSDCLSRDSIVSFEDLWTSDSLCEPENRHMQLVVRIRLALRQIDGGALMFGSLGTDAMLAALPPLPSSVTASSITGFFPPLASM